MTTAETAAGRALEQAARVALARREFTEYVRFVHGRELYRHQALWARELTRSDITKTAIICPPESWKSTTARWLLEWMIGNDPDIAILLVMNTAAQASRQALAIQETLLRNEQYRQVFPWVKPDANKPWRQDAIYVERRERRDRPEPTLYGTGIDGPYQGVHVDLIFVDDPTNQDDVSSEAIMRAQRDRLRGVLIDRRAGEDARFWAVFTRWGEADLKRDFEEMGFSILEQPVEGRYPWGRLLCPELFDDERIQALKREKGSAMYALTYMCNPEAAAGSLAKREYWRFLGELPTREIFCHSWDFSTGKNELSDYSAFGQWRRFEEGYLLSDLLRARLDFPEAVKRVVTLWERDRPRAVLIEDSPNATPIIQYLKAHHSRIPVVAVKPGSRDKVARLKAVLPLIEGGRVWLLSGQSWERDYLDEMAAFPGGAHDDQVDMTSQALEWMERNGGWRPRGGGPVFLSGPVRR